MRETYGVETEVEYPEVDVEHFSPSDGPRAPHVLSVGAIEPAKGHDFLVRSLARISPGRRPPLEIVADRAVELERCYLEELACRLGVDLRLPSTRRRLHPPGTPGPQRCNWPWRGAYVSYQGLANDSWSRSVRLGRGQANRFPWSPRRISIRQ